MPNRLEKLTVREVSLVDAGANRGSVAVLMKRAKDVSEETKQFFIKMANALGFPEVAAKIHKKEGEMPANIEDVVKRLESLEVAKKLSDDIGSLSISLSKAKTKKEVKEAEAEIEKLDKNDSRVGVLKDMALGILKRIEKHEAYSALLEGNEKDTFEALDLRKKDAYMAKKPKSAVGSSPDDGGSSAEDGGSSADDSSSDDDDEKSATKKRLDEEIKKNDGLRVRVEKMEEEKAITKIKSEELKGVVEVAKADELAKSIYTIRKTNPAQADILVAQLKSLAAQNAEAQKILTQEIGKGAAVEGSAEQKLESLAKIKSTKENISFAKAMSVIMDTDEGKELYKQSEAEKKPTRE